MNWQAVFFDFDGVIVDSVPAKGKAFADLFRDYGPKIEKKVVEYHYANGGVSREEKFKYYYRELIKQSLTEEKLTQLCRQFSGLVLEKVISASYLDGVLESLDKLKKREIPAFIVSGTPQVEIRLIVKERKLEKYFHGVYGSPEKKADIITEILNTESFNPRNCLFIGDSMSDYEGAQIANVNFLGIVSNGQISPFSIGTKISEFVVLD